MMATVQESFRQNNLTWPKGPRPTQPELRLLRFVEELIVEVGRTHPHVTNVQIARWLTAVVRGGRP
jgi:hypothetical protein